MFLALRELHFARTRFALMGLVVALVAVLVVLLSGLATGLVNHGVSSLQRIPVDAFAFADGSKKESAFSRSIVGRQELAAWQERPDVASAELFGNQLVNTDSADGVAVDLALFGVEPGSALLPAVAEGRLPARPAEIIVSETARAEGVELGTVLRIDRPAVDLTVVGVAVGQHTFGHVEVAYLALDDWQAIAAGEQPGSQAGVAAPDEATAIALTAVDGSIDLAAGDAAAETWSLTREGSFHASPGFTAETSTLELIQVFLYVIGALVVGAFFTVWTIQRKHELAVLRAMGASTAYLLRDGLTQAVILLLAATGIGTSIGLGTGALVGDGVPFALETGPVVGAVLALVVLGLFGAAVAIARIAFADPLAALGSGR